MKSMILIFLFLFVPLTIYSASYSIGPTGSGANFNLISEAILSASVTTNDILNVQPGTYEEPNIVVIDKSVSIIGAGTPSSIILHRTKEDSFSSTTINVCLLPDVGSTNLFFLVTQNNVTIQNLTFDGDKNNDGIDVGRGIQILSCSSSLLSNITIQNCRFINIGHRAIASNDVSNYLIDNCTFDNINGDPQGAPSCVIRAPSCLYPSMTFSNNTINNCLGGVNYNYPSSVTFINNRVSNSTGYGVCLYNGAEGYVANNTFDHIGYAIYTGGQKSNGSSSYRGEVHCVNNTSTITDVAVYIEGYSFSAIWGTTPGLIAFTNNVFEWVGTNISNTFGAVMFPSLVAGAGNEYSPNCSFYNNIISGFETGIGIDVTDSLLSTTVRTNTIVVQNNHIKALHAGLDVSGSNTWSGNYYSDSNIVDANDDLSLDSNYNVNYYDATKLVTNDLTGKAVLTVSNIQGTFSSTTAKNIAKTSKSVEKDNSIYLLFSLFFSIIGAFIFIVSRKLKNKLFKISLFFIVLTIIEISCFGGGTIDDFVILTTSSNSATTSTIPTKVIATGNIIVTNNARFSIENVYIPCYDLTNASTSSIVINCTSSNVTFSSANISIQPQSTASLSFTLSLDYSTAIDGIYNGNFEVISSNGNTLSLKDSFNLYIEVQK